MKKVLVLFFMATVLFSCKNPKLLSRPIIDPPLFECAKTVTVKGFVPGAEIRVYANGAMIASGVSTSPEGQVFNVNPELTTGSSITARQFFDGEESASSDPVVVVHPLKFYSGNLPKPELKVPIYDCGGAISVRNLVKGGVLQVFSDTAQVGIVNGCGEGQWLRVNPVFSEGQYVKATVAMCNNTSPVSDSVRVEASPSSLPQLEISDIYENGTRCIIHNITNGAKVKVFNNDSLIKDVYYSGGSQICNLPPPVVPGDVITAIQEMCGVESEPSDPTTVKPCSELPAPKLGLICAGDGSIKITDSELGARITVYRDGALAADGGGNEVMLLRSAMSGENYWATQSLGSCVSPASVPIAVGCDAPTIMKPQIPYAGRAVAVGVDKNDDSRIMVASETGGLFRSTNKGANWQQVSRDNTFKYTDVTYLNFDEDVVIAVAREDSREKSGGGIWRSKNNGSTWKKVELSTPTANCFDDIRANCISIDPQRNRIWVGTSCGLAFSDNSGADWSFQPVVAGYNNEQVYAIKTPDSTRIVMVTGAGIQVSSDGGASFSSVMGALPNRWTTGWHNQIDVPAKDHDHIYFAAHYTPNNDSVNYRGLFWSQDFGATWDTVYKKQGNRNRRPFVRIANESLVKDKTWYDVYFGDGQNVFTRTSAKTGNSGDIGAWSNMAIDHADPADMGFARDNKTPLLLLTDGGLHKTDDLGESWTLTGGGPAGYNALQITEVTGQFHEDGKSADLYFATQDNSIWASPDLGSTWPRNTCCEGFYLNIMRNYYPNDQTDFSGVRCGACRNFVTKPLINGVSDFNNAPKDIGNPRLLRPKNYIQNTFPFDSVGSLFSVTTDLGANWDSSFVYQEETVSFPDLAGPLNNPTVFNVFRSSAPAIGGIPALEIKRITGVLSAAGPVVSDINGFGNLGIFPTMFAWYEVFGVDPSDPNYLIVPDMVDDSVKISTDGGMTWRGDSILTSAIISNGEFMFNWGKFSQVSCIEVNPDCPDNILVGTQQSGIFVTYNRGETWGRVHGSEQLPYVSSFFFAPDGVVIISTYGRGLWKMKVNCTSKEMKDMKKVKMQYSAPFALHNTSIVALSAINEPTSGSITKYLLVKDGNITDYVINEKTQQLLEVFISSGSVEVYNSGGAPIKPTFKVSFNKKPGAYSGNRNLLDYLTDEVKVKGIILEKNAVKAPILAQDDISAEQLPKQSEAKPYATVLNKKGGVSVVENFDAVRVLVKNFNPKTKIEVFVDGELVQWKDEPETDATGRVLLSIPQDLEVGDHTVVIKQKGNNRVMEATTGFVKGTYD